MRAVPFDVVDSVVELAYGEPLADLLDFVALTARQLSLPREQLLHKLAEEAAPLFADEWPDVVEGHSSTRTFLLTLVLNKLTFGQRRRRRWGTLGPIFELAQPAKTVLVLSYRGRRGLCALAGGFVEGMAAHFGEAVTVEHSRCLSRGDRSCKLRCEFKQSGEGQLRDEPQESRAGLDAGRRADAAEAVGRLVFGT